MHRSCTSRGVTTFCFCFVHHHPFFFSSRCIISPPRELQREKDAVSKQVQQLKLRMQRAREQDRRALVKITTEVRGAE
jgi:hypothetical protein